MNKNKETHRKRLEKVLKLQCLTALQMYLLLQVRIRVTRKFVMSVINSLNLVCISGQQAWYSSSKKDEHQTNSQSFIFTTHLPNISWEKYTFGALLHNTPYAIHGNTQLCWNQTSPPPHTNVPSVSFKQLTYSIPLTTLLDCVCTVLTPSLSISANCKADRS